MVLARVDGELGEELDDGRYGTAAPVTFNELLDRWIEVRRLDLESTTASSYKWLATKYLRPALGDRRLASIR